MTSKGRHADSGKATRALVVGVWLLWCVLGHVHGSTQESTSETQNNVTLQNTFAPSGEELRVPIYVSTDPDAVITHIALKVGVPSESVKFLKVETGFLADDTRVRFSAREVEAVLNIDLVSTANGGKEPILSGLMGFLVFKAVAAVEKDLQVELPIRALSMVGADGQTFKVGKKTSALVTILPAGAAPLIACFFYMH